MKTKLNFIWIPSGKGILSLKIKIRNLGILLGLEHLPLGLVGSTSLEKWGVGKLY